MKREGVPSTTTVLSFVETIRLGHLDCVPLGETYLNDLDKHHVDRVVYVFPVARAALHLFVCCVVRL